MFGLPNLLVSDNKININSTEFNELYSSNGINYLKLRIYHPCSNGQAENSVRMCKKNLKYVLKDYLLPSPWAVIRVFIWL